jgi:toxin ParE1/3/4
VSRPSRFNLLLTQRALRDIQDIRKYSAERWGKTAAEKYLDELEAGLVRLKEHPHLLKAEADFHAALMFYRVNRHLLVCDTQPRSIVVLTVIHSSMDIPSRLAELQPTLAAEVEILHRRLASDKSKEP